MSIPGLELTETERDYLGWSTTWRQKTIERLLRLLNDWYISQIDLDNLKREYRCRHRDEL